ncbi:hypothetical protein DQ04_16391000 [Trypanosoma grayi]|uniref:hypothetical protein n=1 Tax=Trypanosoma grayi TaxID=71804 RepID=UPI0004F41D80|nr:hypothetical protein DQ04_16391000 [Trypanosoma grayi]KEG06036.1 hypothetical protein DQ04_16391000 [Trypanosoma grayi]
MRLYTAKETAGHARSATNGKKRVVAIYLCTNGVSTSFYNEIMHIIVVITTAHGPNVFHVKIFLLLSVSCESAMATKWNHCRVATAPPMEVHPPYTDEHRSQT